MSEKEKKSVWDKLWDDPTDFDNWEELVTGIDPKECRQCCGKGCQVCKGELNDDS